MRQLTIRNIDDDVYARLRERAKTNRRSLEAEIRDILDRCVRPDRSELVRRTAAMRERLKIDGRILHCQ